MNRFLRCASTFFLLLCAASSFAVAIKFEGNIAKVSMAFDGSDSVTVSVEEIEVPNDYAYSKAYMWGGDETSPPKKIIKAITILRNGQAVFIPLSAYVDLGSPKTIALEKLPARGFRLTIRGGDAAGSYSAMLDFNKAEISRRKVVSGEFPKEVWEATTFSFNHLSN